MLVNKYITSVKSVSQSVSQSWCHTNDRSIEEEWRSFLFFLQVTIARKKTASIIREVGIPREINVQE